MGITVKNLRPGVLILADARLRLGPGEVAEIAILTPQIRRAIETGRLARLDEAATPPEAGEPATESLAVDGSTRRRSQGGKRSASEPPRRGAAEQTEPNADFLAEVKPEESASGAA